MGRRPSPNPCRCWCTQHQQSVSVNRWQDLELRQCLTSHLNTIADAADRVDTLCSSYTSRQGQLGRFLRAPSHACSAGAAVKDAASKMMLFDRSANAPALLLFVPAAPYALQKTLLLQLLNCCCCSNEGDDDTAARPSGRLGSHKQIKTYTHVGFGV
jgi:hypothetical protein